MIGVHIVYKNESCFPCKTNIKKNAARQNKAAIIRQNKSVVLLFGIASFYFWLCLQRKFWKLSEIEGKFQHTYLNSGRVHNSKYFILMSELEMADTKLNRN